MAKPTGSSKLLVKVAHTVESMGEKNFLDHLDQLLISKDLDKNATKHRPVDKRAICIINIIARELGISNAKVRSGLGETGRFGLNLCYFFFHSDLTWSNKEIASYFGRDAEGSVRYGLRMVGGLNPKYDGEKIEKKKLIEEKIKLHCK